MERTNTFVTEAYFRFFEPVFAFGKEARAKTTLALRAARIPVFPEWYLTSSYIAAITAAFAAIVLSSGALLGLTGIARPVALLIAGAAGLAAFSGVRLGFLVYPRLVASSRATRIDAEFPSVVVLCYSLARGGVGAVETFRAVAQERETYGEISVEFGLVIRDIDWLGEDLVGALRSVGATTPSLRLKAFFEGLVTIINAGADPRDYFRRQAEMQLAQAEVNMLAELDQAALLAEVYVSGLLVLPLLLIVILSVLSALGNGGESFVPMIVFGLIPVGTAGYLLLTDMMLPPDALQVPKSPRIPLDDFGMDSVSIAIPVLPPPGKPTVGDVKRDLLEKAEAENVMRRQLYAEWFRRRFTMAHAEFVERVLVKPMDAFALSGSAALVALVGGLTILWMRGDRGYDLFVGGTGVLLVGLLIALVPIGIFHELRVRRARRLDGALPDALSKLAGFNERGISLLRSFQILSRTATGPLAKELRALDRDVTWNASLQRALGRFRLRVSTLRIMKISVLFQRASAATGQMKDVLEIAAADATRTENMRARKAQSMMSYVVVIYVVFAVFLYTVYMTTNLFYGEGGFAAAAAAAGPQPGGGSTGMDPESARLLFFHAVLLQGVCSGFVAGKLGEGHILSGVKHAAILSVIAWAIFRVGVIG